MTVLLLTVFLSISVCFSVPNICQKAASFKLQNFQDLILSLFFVSKNHSVFFLRCFHSRKKNNQAMEQLLASSNHAFKFR